MVARPLPAAGLRRHPRRGAGGPRRRFRRQRRLQVSPAVRRASLPCGTQGEARPGDKLLDVPSGIRPKVREGLVRSSRKHPPRTASGQHPSCHRGGCRERTFLLAIEPETSRTGEWVYLRSLRPTPAPADGRARYSMRWTVAAQLGRCFATPTAPDVRNQDQRRAGSPLYATGPERDPRPRRHVRDLHDPLLSFILLMGMIYVENSSDYATGAAVLLALGLLVVGPSGVLILVHWLKTTDARLMSLVRRVGRHGHARRDGLEAEGSPDQQQPRQHPSDRCMGSPVGNLYNNHHLSTSRCPCATPRECEYLKAIAGSLSRLDSRPPQPSPPGGSRHSFRCGGGRGLRTPLGRLPDRWPRPRGSR